MGLLRQLLVSRRCLPFGSGLVLATGIVLSLSGTSALSPWLRIVVGLLVFLLPGGFVFVLISPRDSWDILDFVGYGLTFSITLITVLGLITRTLALSIADVELVWYVMASIGLATVLFRLRAAPSRILNVNPIVLIFVAIVFVQSALFAHSSLFAAPTTREQYREQAYINGFLRADPLGWSEPFYETGYPIADRDWLTYWVLAQALVVEISSVPILLARYLVNPFVVVVSVAGMYIFARNLGHQPKYALAYTALGLLGLSLVAETTNQAGGTFFVLSMYDKVMVSFAMAPVAISTAYLCYSTGGRRAYVAFALSFLGISCAHPMMGGFAAVVIVVWCFLRVLTERGGAPQAIKFGLLTVALFSPAIILRAFTPAMSTYDFDNTSLISSQQVFVFDSSNALDNGNAFFAINAVTAGELTYLLSALLLLAVATSGLSSRSMLLLAFVIMTGIALIPYTAWIYGRLVVHRHITRTLWLFPYGYMMGFLIEHGFARLRRATPGAHRVVAWLRTDRVLVIALAFSAVITAHSLQIHDKADFTRDIADAPGSEREFLEIAMYIDANHADRVWFAASQELHREAIGLSWKIISLARYTAARMAYHSRLPIDQATRQFEDNLLLYDATVSVSRKLAILEKYGIDYLFFPKQYSWLVDALYQTDKARFELVYSGETLRLVRVHETMGDSR